MLSWLVWLKQRFVCSNSLEILEQREERWRRTAKEVFNRNSNLVHQLLRTQRELKDWQEVTTMLD